MDRTRLRRASPDEWLIDPTGPMLVPAVIFADAGADRAMDQKVLEQIGNVACLPGIVEAAYAMPDAHWGYGFPIGGVAAFDADAGGIVLPGGVGFDISCGVRTLLTGLSRAEIEPVKAQLADSLYRNIPAGVESTGKITLDAGKWRRCWRVTPVGPWPRDTASQPMLQRIEEGGTRQEPIADAVSDRAKERQRQEVGTLGSGNHYLEVQEVSEIFDEAVAGAFGLTRGAVIVSIHCGSRGLGHQIGTEYLREMAIAVPAHGNPVA